MDRPSNFTCRVDEALKEAFLRAAKVNDRSASVLIRDFMRDYVRRTHDRGGLVSHDEVRVGREKRVS